MLLKKNEEIVRVLEIQDDRRLVISCTQKSMFSSDRLSTYEVCLVAMLLGVEPNELVRMTLPTKSQPEWFDEKIRVLHSQGLKYPEIARIMGAPYDVVKAVGEGRY